MLFVIFLFYYSVIIILEYSSVWQLNSAFITYFVIIFFSIKTHTFKNFHCESLPIIFTYINPLYLICCKSMQLNFIVLQGSRFRHSLQKNSLKLLSLCALRTFFSLLYVNFLIRTYSISVIISILSPCCCSSDAFPLVSIVFQISWARLFRKNVSI